MVERRRPRLSAAMTVLAAIVVFFLLVDVVVAARIVATRSQSPGSTTAPQSATPTAAPSRSREGSDD